jgi:mannose PTS system EIID component
MIMSPVHALLIGLLYFAANTSFLAGLGYFTTWRPLVNGLLVGLVLGDPMRGVMTGALINVLYLGYMSVGGTLGIGDAALAGLLGATISIAAPLPSTVEAAGLGVIAGVLLGNAGFPLLSLRMSLDNRIARAMDRAAARGDTRSLLWLNIGAGQALLFGLTVPAAAALAWVATAALGMALPLAPAWVLRGIGTAGTGMAAALGIALAMRFVFKGRGVALFGAGVLTAILLPVNVAWLMVAGLALAAGYFVPRLLSLAAQFRGQRTGATFPLWLFFSHSSYSFERLQGSGFACAMAPAIQRLYTGAEERAEALKRHLAFFNVEPNWGCVILGITLKLEEQRAAGQLDADAITTTKQTLMGSVSGFGDSVSQGAILPLILSVALGISLDGGQPWFPAGGVIVYLCLISAIVLLICYLTFHAGYAHGPLAVILMLGNTTLKRWVAIAEWAGAFMLGALAAMPWVTGLRLAWFGGLAQQIANVAVPLALVMLFYALAQRWRIRPTTLLLGIIVTSLGLAFAGII